MAQNNQLIEQVRPFLDPDERFQSAFPAQSGPTPYLANGVGDGTSGMIGPLLGLIFRPKRRIIAVTDKAVLVLAADGRYKPVAKVARLPRSTRPPRGRVTRDRVDLAVVAGINRPQARTISATTARSTRS